MKKIYETEKVSVESYFDEEKKTMCINIFTKHGLSISDVISFNRAIEKWINSQ